jgi:hypothetical protein
VSAFLIIECRLSVILAVCHTIYIGISIKYFILIMLKHYSNF